MPRVGAWILLILVLGLAGSPAVAMDTELSRSTLKGLRGVSVMIESLEPEVERDGLSRSTIETDVELKLRQAGITVVPPGDQKNSLGAFLYVNVNAIQSSANRGLYAYSVHVAVNQVVRLVRDREVRTVAATWSTGTIVIVGATRISASVRENVRDQVDRFVNAYLAVNPKQ